MTKNIATKSPIFLKQCISHYKNSEILKHLLNTIWVKADFYFFHDESSATLSDK